jgi:hypothetical protein
MKKSPVMASWCPPLVATRSPHISLKDPYRHPGDRPNDELNSVGCRLACGDQAAPMMASQRDPYPVPLVRRPAGWKSGADPARER